MEVFKLKLECEAVFLVLQEKLPACPKAFLFGPLQEGACTLMTSQDTFCWWRFVGYM